MKKKLRDFIQIDETSVLKSSYQIWKSWMMVPILALLSGLFFYGAISGQSAHQGYALLASGVCAIAAFFLARWLLVPAPPQVHEVTVRSSSRPSGETIFTADCSCGWEGDIYDTETEARLDGTGHNSNVRLDVDELEAE